MLKMNEPTPSRLSQTTNTIKPSSKTPTKFEKTPTIGSAVTRLGLRVELRAEERLALVADALVSAIVDIGKERPPPLAELGVINGIAMVLGSDVALVRQAVHYWLGVSTRSGE